MCGYRHGDVIVHVGPETARGALLSQPGCMRAEQRWAFIQTKCYRKLEDHGTAKHVDPEANQFVGTEDLVHFLASAFFPVYSL